MISIVVADDRALLREALDRLIASLPDCRVTGSGCAEELRQMLARESADVIVLHASAGAGTARITECVRAADPVPVLVVGSQPTSVLSALARRAGAAGHVSTHDPVDELLLEIRRVAYAGAPAEAATGEREDAQLSEREFEVLCLMGSGLNGKGVADALGISPKTVSTYRTRILEKLKLTSTADIVRFALEHGLVG